MDVEGAGNVVVADAKEVDLVPKGSYWGRELVASFDVESVEFVEECP